MTKPWCVRLTIPLLLTTLLVAACGADPDPAPAEASDQTLVRDAQADPPPEAPADTRTPADPDDPATVAIVDALNAFASDLYHALATEHPDDNLLFSPTSIAVSLAMLRAGATGETAAQIDAVLHAEGIDLPTALGGLDALLATRSGRIMLDDVRQVRLTLDAPQALWGPAGTVFADPFTATLTDAYASAPLTLPADPQAATDAINAWVHDETDGEIPTLFDDALSPETGLVLASALALDPPPWVRTFSSREWGDFQRVDGSTAFAPYMGTGGRFLYAEGDGYRAIEIWYSGATLTMLLLIPDPGRFAAFEAGLDLAAIFQTLDVWGYFPDVRLEMPRFTLAMRQDLTAALEAMGVRSAFIADRAELGDALDPVAGGVAVLVQSMVHATQLEVTLGGQPRPVPVRGGFTQEPTSEVLPEPMELRLDRPFLFLIRDIETGAPLLLGRVLDPTQ